jgi:hypothetical protein
MAPPDAAGVICQALRSGGMPPLCHAAGKGSCAAIKALLDGGANLESAASLPLVRGDRRMLTPLGVAAEAGELTAVNLLVDKGAAPNGPPGQGFEPPLCCAVTDPPDDEAGRFIENQHPTDFQSPPSPPPAPPPLCVCMQVENTQSTNFVSPPPPLVCMSIHLKVSQALTSVQCLFSMTLLAGGQPRCGCGARADRGGGRPQRVQGGCAVALLAAHGGGRRGCGLPDIARHVIETQFEASFSSPVSSSSSYPSPSSSSSSFSSSSF